MTLKLLLFDIDGTLLHASPSGRDAFSEALQEVYGVADPLSDISFAGQTDPNIWRKIRTRHQLSEDKRLESRFFQRYADILKTNLQTLALPGRLCPGIPHLLQKLQQEEHFRLSLVTGNMESGANIKLKAFGLDHFFHRGAYGSDHRDRNRLGPIALRRAEEAGLGPILPQETAVIGDTPWDVDCGHAMDAVSIGVATGSYSEEQLQEAGATLTLPNFDDVDRVIQAFKEGI